MQAIENYLSYLVILLYPKNIVVCDLINPGAWICPYVSSVTLLLSVLQELLGYLFLLIVTDAGTVLQMSLQVFSCLMDQDFF